MAVAYFTAVIAQTGAAWRALDVDVEDAESLDELAELLRAGGRGGPVVAVIEREDDWFALVRVDGDEDPRAFVSDLDALERSQYAGMLAPVGDIEVAEYAHLRAVPAAVAADDTDFAAADELADEADDDTAEAGDVADPTEPTSGNGIDGEPAPVAVEPPTVVEPPAWAGDPGLLSDVGVEAAELVELVAEREGDPASVIAAVGERCGFDELLDALR